MITPVTADTPMMRIRSFYKDFTRMRYPDKVYSSNLALKVSISKITSSIVICKITTDMPFIMILAPLLLPKISSFIDRVMIENPDKEIRNMKLKGMRLPTLIAVNKRDTMETLRPTYQAAKADRIQAGLLCSSH